MKCSLCGIERPYRYMYAKVTAWMKPRPSGYSGVNSARNVTHDGEVRCAGCVDIPLGGTVTRLPELVSIDFDDAS